MRCHMRWQSRNSVVSLCLVLVNSSVGSETMAANAINTVFQNPNVTWAVLEEYFYFLQAFRHLGASGEVTVIDVYNRMRDQGHPTCQITVYMENTDPTAILAPTTAARGKNVSRLLSFSKSCQCTMPTAARGKNVSRLLSFSKSCQCTMQFVYFCRKEAAQCFVSS